MLLRTASMAFKDWFSRRTPLQLALERGTQPGGDLAEELRRLGEYAIKSHADAEAICSVLSRLVPPDAQVGDESTFHSVTGLFQAVEGGECPAFAVMADQGIGLLVQIVNDALRNPSRRDSDDVLFALKILAMYGTPEGTDTVLRAARQPLRPDTYMWSVILQAYTAEHPQSERLFEELSDPLPSDFLAVSLLDSANAAHRDGVQWSHPFDSVAGKTQLERWLTDYDEEHFSYAVSATGALPFLEAPDELLALAFDHPSTDVQLEAAWVAAKLGRDAGIRWLARSCLDVNLAERAKDYLAELGRADAIPPDAEDADFQAKSHFAQWLAHPTELGRPPDELEIFDHRDLKWPPDYQPRPMWLFKYRVKDTTGLKADDVGVGLVGSVTFCLFSYKLQQRPAEDCYAIHCYWEMTSCGLLAQTDVEDDSGDYDQMLGQANVDGLSQVRIIFVTELSPELNYPQRLVALGKTTRNGQPGWIVLDGPRSRWYAANEMPTDVFEKTVLMVHVGRVLLGFTREPDRRACLHPTLPPRAPEQVIAAYERLLDMAHTDAKQAKKLSGVLGSAFTDYVSALSASRSQPLPTCTCVAYEALLAAAQKAETSLRDKFFDSFSPLGEVFDAYVDALIASNRQADVPALVEKFRPHWEHNLGYAKLGTAAFKSGHDELAEAFLLKLCHSMKDWCRNEEIGFLAEIWKRQQRSEEAHTLLIDALKGLKEQSRTATGSDRKLFEEWFQARRAAYLKLFPERGEDELRRHGIPSSTLTERAT
jgi:hypothetical protein